MICFISVHNENGVFQLLALLIYDICKLSVNVKPENKQWSNLRMFILLSFQPSEAPLDAKYVGMGTGFPGSQRFVGFVPARLNENHRSLTI